MPPIISVAPMMNCTDKHARYFLRLIAPDVQLYTEMITVQALIHGDVKRFLAFHSAEHPVVLQLGGSDSKDLAYGAHLGEEFGYDEINLNVGCPSPRVSKGRFGACLMLDPQLVAECVFAMQSKVKIPVTVKCRIGVDDLDRYEDLLQFIKIVNHAGCNTFIIHARKAWLKGLSPKENRDIPPLSYETVYQIKRDFNHLKIIINGGIKSLADIEEHSGKVDGMMLGRAPYANPYLLAEIQAKFFPYRPALSRHQIIEQFLPYVKEQLQNGVRLNSMTRHILGLFQGQYGAAKWRRYLSENVHKTADYQILNQALALLTPS